MSRYVRLPDDFRPESGYTYNGLEGLADCGPYLGGSRDVCWCEFIRVASGSASVYPVKLQVPNRGEGQFKFEEVEGWRFNRYTLEALVEADRARGYPLRGPQPFPRNRSSIPPGIDREWLAGALARG